MPLEMTIPKVPRTGPGAKGCPAGSLVFINAVFRISHYDKNTLYRGRLREPGRFLVVQQDKRKHGRDSERWWCKLLDLALGDTFWTYDALLLKAFAKVERKLEPKEITELVARTNAAVEAKAATRGVESAAEAEAIALANAEVAAAVEAAIK